MEQIPAISNIQSLRDFIFSLYEDYDIPFQPSKKFEEYLTRDGKKKFSTAEAFILNERVKKCFDYCASNNLDLHKIATDVEIKFFFRRAVLYDMKLHQHLS